MQKAVNYTQRMQVRTTVKPSSKTSDRIVVISDNLELLVFSITVIDFFIAFGIGR